MLLIIGSNQALLKVHEIRFSPPHCRKQQGGNVQLAHCDEAAIPCSTKKTRSLGGLDRLRAPGGRITHKPPTVLGKEQIQPLSFFCPLISASALQSRPVRQHHVLGLSLKGDAVKRNNACLSDFIYHPGGCFSTSDHDRGFPASHQLPTALWTERQIWRFTSCLPTKMSCWFFWVALSLPPHDLRAAAAHGIPSEGGAALWAYALILFWCHIFE